MVGTKEWESERLREILAGFLRMARFWERRAAGQNEEEFKKAADAW